ncbi:MAG: glycosyl hydrolase family 5, partial [Firmicutes bacterium]|nr:glycosyl hydrolase family 5 [Bacillota bacterium]
AWYRDVLEILSEFQIGWSIWNFRRDFGILDTDRQDVAYEDWHGHKLDRQLLTLLQAY